MMLVCYVISQEHVTKERCDLIQEPIKVGYHSVKFGGQRQPDSGNKFLIDLDVMT